MTQPGRRRRLLILAICCMSLVIVGLDNTIVNVALPSIQRELHAPVSGLQWIVDAYMLVLASLLMLAGFDRRPAGAAPHLPGRPGHVHRSARCCAAWRPASAGWWRSAWCRRSAVPCSIPVAMSIIVNTFTDRGERARAIGVWGGAVGVSLALGPVVGRRC